MSTIQTATTAKHGRLQIDYIDKQTEIFFCLRYLVWYYENTHSNVPHKNLRAPSLATLAHSHDTCCHISYIYVRALWHFKFTGNSTLSAANTLFSLAFAFVLALPMLLHSLSSFRALAWRLRSGRRKYVFKFKQKTRQVTTITTNIETAIVTRFVSPMLLHSLSRFRASAWGVRSGRKW